MTTLGTADPPQFGEVIKALQGELDQDYAPPHVKRHAHPKMHGCVLARFRVHDDVPEDLRHGLFAEAGEFRAWVRLSNAFGIEHDLKFEGRGLAIKVLGVTGAHLEIPGGDGFSFDDTTQDFVLSTHDAFPLKRADGYDKFAAAARKGLWALVKLFAAARNWRGFVALIRGGLVEARNLLTITYNSQTAYQLGPDDARVRVKVRARPHLTKALRGTFLERMTFRAKVVAVNITLGFSPPGKFLGRALRLLGFKTTKSAADLFCDRYICSAHYLRTVLEESLAREDATFEIGLQRQTSERWMPSDDPTVRWREWRSRFRAVATLTIPRQVFWPANGMPPEILRATKSMVEDGENMSFNPWHGLVEHKPLGHINRARGEIYAAISKYRHGKNVTPLPDPSDEYDRLRDTVLYGAIE
jgi:hypothetical protein